MRHPHIKSCTWPTQWNVSTAQDITLIPSIPKLSLQCHAGNHACRALLPWKRSDVVQCRWSISVTQQGTLAERYRSVPACRPGVNYDSPVPCQEETFTTELCLVFRCFVRLFVWTNRSRANTCSEGDTSGSVTCVSLSGQEDVASWFVLLLLLLLFGLFSWGFFFPN